jgi:hypothetical protein
MLRFGGGSDCCRFLDRRSALTRLLAAYDILASGLSSLAAALTLFCRLISAPVNPVNALLLSTAATNLAFPR